MQTFGIDEPQGNYDDIEHTDTAVLWGANMAEMHPILWSRITDRRLTHKKMKVVNLSVYGNMSSDIADLEIIFAPSADLAIQNYIAHEIVKRGRFQQEGVVPQIRVEFRVTRVLASAQQSQHHGAVHGREPGFDRAGQRVAHGAGAVIKLDSAADVDAARINFDAGALHPVGKQRTQAGQAAQAGHGGEEHLFLKPVVVLAHHGNLQFFA
jgi:hypothetical protein